MKTKNQEDFSIKLRLKSGEIRIPEEGSLFVNKDSYCIIPFNINLNGINLNYSTNQLITKLDYDNEEYYFFFTPKGVSGKYSFKEDNIKNIEVDNGKIKKYNGTIIVKTNNDETSKIKITNGGGKKINICTITKEDSTNLWKLNFEGKERIWEIALGRFKQRLKEEMYIYISPIRKDNKVTSDTTMAGILEISQREIANIKSIKAVPIYNIEFYV